MSLQRHRLLFELWRLRDLRGHLMEGRIDFLRQSFLPRITQALTAGTLHIPLNMVNLDQERSDDQAAMDAASAEHVFQLVLNADPDPVKKNTQWLLTQILRKQNPMPLEDINHAGETLTRYAEMKKARQIPPDKADINAFKSLSELEALMRGEQQQQVMVSDTEQAEMLQQSDVLLNDAEVLLLVPKTLKAACYWGRDTGWCTAWGDHQKLGLTRQGRYPTRTDNYFNHYHQQGPLYVIHEKTANAWWQLHFESSQFMDSEDRPFPIVDLIKRHPAIFKAIGEDKFIRYAEQLGLSWFSPAAIGKIPAYDLGRFIRQKADLKLVPPEKLTDIHFVFTVLGRNGGKSVQWFPAKFVFENATVLANGYYACLPFLPKVLQTQELADQVAEKAGWQAIDEHIPKALRSDAVEKQYWIKRSDHDERCRLAQVPEHFRTLCAVPCLTREPKDIPQFADLLDETMAMQIARATVAAFEYLPERLLNEEAAEVLQHHVDRSARQYNHPDPKTLWARFDPKFWPDKAVDWMIEQGKMDFAKLPAKFRNAPYIAKLINKNTKEAANVPAEYWDTDLLNRVVNKYSNVLSYIDPANVPEDFLVDLPTRRDRPGEWFDEFFYVSKLPAKMKTPRVVAAFVAAGVVSVDKIPRHLMTANNLLARMVNHPDEAKSIPPKLITPDFAVRLVAANPGTMAAIPEKDYTEPVLFTWLSALAKRYNRHADRHGYANDYHHYRHHSGEKFGYKVDKALFDRFPETLWSSRVVALAIDQEFIRAAKASVPQGLLDRDVAGAIIAKNHTDLADLSDVLDDATITSALKHNWKLLQTLPPERMTEPMAFTVMQTFANVAAPVNYSAGRVYHRAGETASPILPLLQAIPKKLWSKRVYQEAVGYVVPLAKVPAKFRDDLMIQAAVQRDPANVKALADPAAWLNTHLRNYGSDDWRAAVETNGVAIVKKKYVNVADLPREPLNGGSTYAVVKAGPSNVRVYLFDKKNKLVLYLYTDKGKVEMPPPELKKAEAHRADMVELARRALTGYEMNVLNTIGIYGNGHYVQTEEGSQKVNYRYGGDLAWSRNDHLDGYMHVGWLKDKPAIRLRTEATNSGWGRNRGGTRITSVKIYDMPYCASHSAEIATYITKQVHTDGGWHELARIGIYYDKQKRAQTIGETLIGTVGSLSIYRNSEGKIGLFTPNGMVASGVVRANGNIDKIEVNHVIDGGISASIAENLFAKISAVLMKDKTATGLKLAEMLSRIGRRL